ncbi:MAG: phosphate/phosphite/phosphonate ABC transporter substrate-binding protein [Candidatus Schekmanbacteria bacterium]|nr:phosphate/phosphite/phosphonate ABC transporter substrate-binding protein [Candidatus Schekmanbacteria bacterium]
MGIGLLGALLWLGATGCRRERAPLGSAENPIKMFFVPSVDAKVLEDTSARLKVYVEKATGLSIKVGIPSSYIAVVEAFGTDRADVSILNTFGYILAHDKYGVEARLTVLRFGKPTYSGQIIARADGPIQTVADIAGKKFAFVDPASTSGYLLPMDLFKKRGIHPAETVFANKHDNVVSMIYQRQVDAGATFYSPPEEGVLQDARRLVLTQYPDVADVIKIVELTESIPNDPVSFRKNMPEEIKTKIVEAFLDYIQTDEGKDTFNRLYLVTGLTKATDADYDGVRELLRSLGKSAADLMQ